MIKKNILLVIGAALLALIPVWLFLIAPELEKLSSDYEFEPKILASENNRFEINGLWTGRIDKSSSYYEKITESKFNSAILESRYTLKNPSGEISYDIEHKFLVDRKSRHNLPGETDEKGEAYAFFPLHVKKQDYQYWPFDFGKNFIVKFKGTESLYGLELYHFSVENAFSDDTAGYEFLELVPEKYKALSRFRIDVYVEPVSGILVNYEDEGTSYYAEQDGTKVQDISEWGEKFDYYTIKSQAEKAKKEKLKIEIYELAVPILLGLAGLVLLSAAFFRKR